MRMFVEVEFLKHEIFNKKVLKAFRYSYFLFERCQFRKLKIFSLCLGKKQQMNLGRAARMLVREDQTG